MSAKPFRTLTLVVVLLCVALPGAAQRTHKYTECDSHKYQGNMTVTAIVQRPDGTAASDCEVAVFDADGECRCSVFSDASLGGLLFLTIQGGVSGEPLTLRAVMDFDTERDYVCTQTLTFRYDATLGDLEHPYALTLTTTASFEQPASGWGTVILPFDFVLPAGLVAYCCDEVTGTSIRLRPAGTTHLSACTPYIICGTAGTYTLTGEPADTKDVYTVGGLTGYLVEETVGERYELRDGPQGFGFYRVDDDAPVVAAGTGTLNVVNGAAFYALDLTGIAPQIAEVADAPVVAYDLLGRPVDTPLKPGIYIVGGRKVLCR